MFFPNMCVTIFKYFRAVISRFASFWWKVIWSSWVLHMCANMVLLRYVEVSLEFETRKKCGGSKDAHMMSLACLSHYFQDMYARDTICMSLRKFQIHPLPNSFVLRWMFLGDSVEETTLKIHLEVISEAGSWLGLQVIMCPLLEYNVYKHRQ